MKRYTTDVSVALLSLHLLVAAESAAQPEPARNQVAAPKPANPPASAPSVTLPSLPPLDLVERDAPPEKVSASAAQPTEDTPTAPAASPKVASALKQAVKADLARSIGQPFASAHIDNITVSGRWAAGTIAVTRKAGASDEFYEFLAQEKAQGWEVALDTSPRYQTWLPQTPDDLVSRTAKVMLLTHTTAGDGSARLSLPFATGETWTFDAGPHYHLGGSDPAVRPWSSIDLGKANGQVRAMNGGILFINCAGSGGGVRVKHTNGWRTSYFHIIPNPKLVNGQQVARGDLLGTVTTVTNPNCVQNTDGNPHVHISVAQSTENSGGYVDIGGKDIGGYTVIEGSAPRQGQLQKVATGALINRGGQVYNDGSIGSGLKPPAVPVLSSPGHLTSVGPFPPNLCWAAAARAEFYKVTVVGDNGFSVVSPNLTSTCWQAASGSVFQRYSWMVVAYNQAGSASSAIWSYTLIAPPFPPSLFTPSNNETVRGVPMLCWQNGGGATSYKVHVYNADNGVVTHLTSPWLTSTCYTPGEIQGQYKTWTWWVVGRNAAGKAPSEYRYFTYLPMPPAAPLLISPANQSSSSHYPPTLCWQSVAGATHYAAYVYRGDGTNYNSGWITGTCWTPTPITGNVGTWTWWAMALNSGGTSPYSEFRYFTITP